MEMLGLNAVERFPKPLEMHDFPLPQIFNNLIDIRVIGNPENIVVRCPCFLFCCNHVRTTNLEARCLVAQKVPTYQIKTYHYK